MNIDTKRFVIGVDLDDTLLDYTNDFRRWLSRETNTPLETLGHPTAYDMSNVGWPGIASYEEFLHYHNMFVRNGFFSQATVLPHAAEAMRAFADAGIYIKVITTRFCSADPMDKAQVIAETAKMLYTNGIPFDEFMVSSHKEEIFTHLSIDDSPKNVEKFVADGRQVIVPNTTGYTAATAAKFGVPLMEDWVQGKAMILEAAEKFRDAVTADMVAA